MHQIPVETLRSVSQTIFASANVPLRYPDPRILIHAIGGEVIATLDPIWVRVVENTVYYQWSADSRERGLALHYGLARVAADIWCPTARAEDIRRLVALNIVPVQVSIEYADAIVAAQVHAPEKNIREAIRENILAFRELNSASN